MAADSEQEPSGRCSQVLFLPTIEQWTVCMIHRDRVELNFQRMNLQQP
jgi:hypothetical protein